MPLIAPESCFAFYPESKVKLPRVTEGPPVPEEALRRQNEKIWGMDNEQQKQVISAYMASVRFMDEQVGRLIEALERLKLRDRTIVIFLSDHGYNLGEHDCWSKVSLWEGSVRVPLIISHPDFPENHGHVCKTILELIDVYPTLTELCGLAGDQPEILQGKSFANHIRQKGTPEEKACAYTISYGGQAATIRTDQWRYTRWDNEAVPGNEELYDHINDPEEEFNCVHDPRFKGILKEMREKYDSIRTAAGKPIIL